VNTIVGFKSFEENVLVYRTATSSPSNLVPPTSERTFPSQPPEKLRRTSSRRKILGLHFLKTFVAVSELLR
jgi:hypothetical protein